MSRPFYLQRRLLLLLTFSAILPPAAAVHPLSSGCAIGAGALELKAADVCDGRRSVVFTVARPLVTFDDWLPKAACNLSILVPAPAIVGLFGRLRYLAIRLFRPSPHDLDELRRRRGLCLETAFSIRPAAATGGELNSEAPPLRERRSCLSPETADGTWLFEELPLLGARDINGTLLPTSPTPSQQSAPQSGLLVQLAWRLVRQPGATVADETSASETGPPPPPPAIRLAFSVAPFFNCSGSSKASSFVYCQPAPGIGDGLCVPKLLACCSPVVNYLECPKRALFMSSVLDCAFYNHDIGFYLFLVIVGSAAVLVIIIYLTVRPIVAAARGEKLA